MTRQEVDSSNIASVGYDHESRTLEIKFHKGSIYQYHPVTKEGYKSLMNAESIGSYFYKNIRNNKLITTERVSDGKEEK